jgi:hypothetical protein
MKKLFVLVAIVLLLLAIGCSERDGTAPSSSTTTVDESTPDAQTVLESSSPSEWRAPEGSAVFQSMLDSIDTSFDVYVASFIWGQFARRDDTGAIPTDWSGTLNFNGVAHLKVHNLVSFEKGQDSLLPQPDSGTLAWISTVFRDYDGINLHLLVKRGVVYIVEPALRFTTRPFSLEIPLSKLDGYNGLFKVDDHNGIVVFTRLLPRRQCPHGAILGVWRRDSTRMAGPFDGLWITGEPTGIVMPPTIATGKVFGRFFTTNTDGPLFEGVYTDTVGSEIGKVYGKWGYDDPTMCPLCGNGHAWFKGWYTVNGQGVAGEVSGELGGLPGPTPSVMALAMKGKWRPYCTNAYPNTNESVN